MPELRQEIPFFRDALSNNYEDKKWVYKHDKHITSFSKEELRGKGIDEMYYTDLTTSDVKQLGFSVVKVFTPKLHLLTGDFNYPYLGLFKSKSLFTKFPHPFP